MPATLIDSAVFGDIFSTPAMRRVWSDENRTQKYLDIEAALARVQPRLGIIPQAARTRSRECAHDLVYDLCRESVDKERPLIELTATHPQIAPHLDRAALERILDPANYLGQAGSMVDRVWSA